VDNGHLALGQHLHALIAPMLGSTKRGRCVHNTIRCSMFAPGGAARSICARPVSVLAVTGSPSPRELFSAMMATGMPGSR
jgi:hypothetical protein